MQFLHSQDRDLSEERNRNCPREDLQTGSTNTIVTLSWRAELRLPYYVLRLLFSQGPG